MIAGILFFLLLVLSLRGFVWGLMKPERIYQFPLLFGAAWLFYMIPQAFGVLSNSGKFPEGVLQDSGIEIALLMSVLCVYAGWRGYFACDFSESSTQKVKNTVSRVFYFYSDERLFQAGVILYVIGFYANYLLASLTGGFIQQFTSGGHYSLQWTGLPVMYVFFGQLVYPGLLFVCLAFFRRPTIPRSVILLLFSIYPLAMTVFLGRRSMTVYLILIMLLSLFFTRRWLPPRALVAAGAVLIGMFVLIAPQYRTITQYGFDLEQIREIQVQSSLVDMFSGEQYAEFDAFVVSSAAMNREMLLGLGTGFYNATVAQLVPRQLVGESIKTSLMFDLWDSKINTEKLYSWNIPYGSNPTGVANAFTEFWFAGALVYFFAAFYIRRLWEVAVHPHNHGAQVWYVVISILVPVSVIGSLFILPGKLLTMYVFLTPLLLFARKRFRLSNRSLNIVSSKNGFNI